MAIYRSVQMSFWTDSKVMDDFTPEDKLFFLYIMTNPRTSLCGCYECSKKQMSRDIGYSEETITNIIYRMDKIHGVAKYDEDTREILILNWDKYNWIGSTKVLEGAYKGAVKIKSREFKYYVLIKLLKKGFSVPEKLFEEIGYPYPMDITYTFTFTDNNNLSTQETINDHNKEEEEKKTEENFDQFWAEYPKKKCKADARKAFAKVMKSKQVDYEIMMAELRKQKQTRDWLKEDGQYVPNAATWLNGKRWEDEVTVSDMLPVQSRKTEKVSEMDMLRQKIMAEQKLNGGDG